MAAEEEMDVVIKTEREECDEDEVEESHNDIEDDVDYLPPQEDLKTDPQDWTTAEEADIKTEHAAEEVFADFQCTMCPVKCPSQRQLTTHLRMAHDVAPSSFSSEHSCSDCGKSFKSSQTLKAHMRNMHEGEKEDYVCGHCDRAFTHKGSLKAHMKSAHTDMKHKCTECDYTHFALSRIKAHHRIVHLKIRDHVCRWCEKSFGTRGALNLHEKGVHLKIKDHVCDICGTGFSTKENLATHKKSVHLKIKVLFCVVSFPSNGELRIQTFHALLWGS